MAPNHSDRIRVGVSACLLGQAVRFDGGHKRDDWLVATLGRLVEFVPVCPEVELGLGVPRASLRRESHAAGIRLIAPASSIDHTAAMRTYAYARVAALARERLSGYVLKKTPRAAAWTSCKFSIRRGPRHATGADCLPKR